MADHKNQLEPEPQISTLGRGVANLAIPLWIRLYRAFFLLAFAFLFISIAFNIAGWSFLEHGNSTGLKIKALILLFAAFAIMWIIHRIPFSSTLFQIKRDTRTYSGFRTAASSLGPLLIIALVTGFSVLTLKKTFDASPLPLRLEQHHVSNKIAISETDREKIWPVFFWDYSVMLPSDFLNNREIIIPYEVGPPEKLLSRIIFRDSKTREPELELHGRRPRSYDLSAIGALFKEFSDRGSIDYTSVHIPLLYQLEKEAGMIDKNGRTPGGERPPVMSYVSFDNGVRIFGAPWSELVSGDEKKGSGRFFFHGPDGSVFQVRCHEPCRAKDLLSRVEFPTDPRGSVSTRIQFIRERAKKALLELNPNADAGTKKISETKVLLYLVSLITLDPRDPEAYFHIGKLTSNRETLNSMIEYGRDIRMDQAQLSELKSRLNAFSQ